MDEAVDFGCAQGVRDRHKDELLNRFQAVGLGIGKQGVEAGGGYVIVVYLDSEHQRPEAPVSVEGVPIRFEVIGQVRALASAAG